MLAMGGAEDVPVIDRIWIWSQKPASPLQFWLPQSGPVGGLILGALVFVGLALLVLAVA